jgi:hypothetical protein
VKDDFYHQDFDIPAGFCPKTFPSPAEEEKELLPPGTLFCPFKSPLQIDAYSEPHSKNKKDEGGNEHGVKDEVFINPTTIHMISSRQWPVYVSGVRDKLDGSSSVSMKQVQ